MNQSEHDIQKENLESLKKFFSEDEVIVIMKDFSNEEIEYLIKKLRAIGKAI